MVGERVKAWTDQFRKDARGLADAVEHRIQFGDPPLLNPSEDLGISPLAALEAKRQRIKRRRALLDLPYESYSGSVGRR